MRIGRVVSFKHQIGGNELAPKMAMLVGQVVGMMSKGYTVGTVPEDATEEGLAVQITSGINADVVWVPRGLEHDISRTGLGEAVVKLLGVKVGASRKDKMQTAQPFGQKYLETPDNEEDENYDDEDNQDEIPY